MYDAHVSHETEIQRVEPHYVISIWARPSAHIGMCSGVSLVNCTLTTYYVMYRSAVRLWVCCFGAVKLTAHSLRVLYDGSTRATAVWVDAIVENI